MRRRTVQLEIRLFVSVLRSSVTQRLTEAKRRVRILRRMGTVSKSAMFLAAESVNSAAREKLRCKFLARKVQNSSRISALLRWRHFHRSLSLSLSPSAPHTQYRKRFPASYNNVSPSLQLGAALVDRVTLQATGPSSYTSEESEEAGVGGRNIILTTTAALTSNNGDTLLKCLFAALSQDWQSCSRSV